MKLDRPISASLSDEGASLPSPIAASAHAWHGCDPAPGMPIARLGFCLVLWALALATGLLLQVTPLNVELLLLTCGCALFGLHMLIGCRCALCRVVPTREGLDIVWRVSPNAWSPVRFVTERPRWREVLMLQKVHTPDDGESGERWSVSIGVAQARHNGRTQLDLQFENENRLDGWLREAERRRLR